MSYSQSKSVLKYVFLIPQPKTYNPDN